MPWLKRIGRSEAAHRILCAAIAFYIRGIWSANRWTVEGREHADRLHEAGRPYIGAFWHGRLLMMPFGWPRATPISMLISAHPDGRMIADAVKRLGVDVIPGSTNRGANDALRNWYAR